MYQYEDETLQAIILSLIPPEVQEIGQQVPQIKALLKWFKEDFFTWCDRPKCPKCNTNTQVAALGSESSNALERSEGSALNTEKYSC